MTITIENLDPRPVAIGTVAGIEANVYFADAGTLAKGTILGRETTSATAYAGTVTGTGTRVSSLTGRAGRSMKPGAYTLVAGTLSSGVGAWTMTDPDGESESFTSSAAGDDLPFPGLGVEVGIAATGTNFVTADSVAFTVVAASGVPLFKPFAPTGANGLQNPTAVLLDALTATEAGNVAARPAISGTVNQNLLVIDDDSAVSLAVIDQLRANGISPVATTELGEYDNPQS